MTILDQIIETKYQEVEVLKSRCRTGSFACDRVAAPKEFLASLTSSESVGVIAEIKRESPGAGVIRPDLDPVKLALDYESSGAAAISVLTDREYFGGSLDDLRQVKRSVNLPILRKDFIIDESQVYESFITGADAILLIVSVLEDQQIVDYRQMAEGLGMTALIEVHDLSELERGLRAGASLLGINNRDLKTFDTRLETTLSLLNRVPSEVVLVSESGIHTRQDVCRLGHAGVDAVLVGESLLRKENPGEAVQNLSGQERRGRGLD